MVITKWWSLRGLRGPIWMSCEAQDLEASQVTQHQARGGPWLCSVSEPVPGLRVEGGMGDAGTARSHELSHELGTGF